MISEQAADLNPTAYAVPRRGYVLSTAVEDLAADLRAASQNLSAKPIEPTVRDALGMSRNAAVRWTEREVWAAIGIWITATKTAQISSSGQGSDAIRWFVGCNSVVSPTFDAVARDHLSKVADDPRTSDLLPYLIDAHGPGSRLSVRKNPATAQSRARKKMSGVFYTPADVADFMVASVLAGSLKNVPPTFLDPAVGTGVFLRSALSHLRLLYPHKAALDLVTEYLFGVDIDAFALDGAAFVLLHDVLLSGVAVSPMRAWQEIRANLAHFDSLTLVRGVPEADQTALPSIFPKLAGGADIVLGNPPYAPIGPRSNAETLQSHFETAPASSVLAGDLYPLFIEQMVRLGNDAGSGAMVVPLSIACNSGKQFRACRSLIQKSAGEWRFAFFDREPHALFGEDVKTRSAIILRNRSLENTPSIHTGPLRRWRGDSRSALFRSIEYTEISSSITKGIGKVRGAVQAEALASLATATPLGSLLLNFGKSTLDQLPVAHRAEVLVGPTAYNFLNVARATPLPIGRGESLSENPLIRLMAVDVETASIVYALLTSSFSFWWWHVNGDGFHVNMSTLLEMPIGDLGNRRSVLAELGNAIWHEARRSPIRSSNRGRVTFAYPVAVQSELRLRVDELIRANLALGDDFGESLTSFVSTVLDARLFEPAH